MTNPPTEPHSPTTDRWADWLLHGRQRGLTAQQRRGLAAGLRRIRDRVLRGAPPRPGQRLLDVGAGTGLIALGARRRAGPEGLVVALDISHDALRETDRGAAQEDGGAPVAPVRGDAFHLPMASDSFDVVYTRSVLIYVQDKAGAIRELHRVLKPGGRVSIFEPINGAGAAYPPPDQHELESVQPEHEQLVEHHKRIVEYLRAEARDSATMLDFDERDLVRWFVDAGFGSVRLTYELTYGDTQPRSRAELLAWFRQRPNPGSPSYEEGARAVLGDAADYLMRVAEFRATEPRRQVGAAAYVTAVR